MCTPNTCAPTHPHLRIHTSTPARAHTSPQTSCAVSRAAAPNDHRRGEVYAAVVHIAFLSNQQRLAHSTQTLVPWCRLTPSATPSRRAVPRMAYISRSATTSRHREIDRAHDRLDTCRARARPIVGRSSTRSAIPWRGACPRRAPSSQPRSLPLSS